MAVTENDSKFDGTVRMIPNLMGQRNSNFQHILPGISFGDMSMN